MTGGTITLISTLRHNPGDEFIRMGFEYLLSRTLGDVACDVVMKHDPRTLFVGFRQRTRPPHRLVAPFLYRAYAAAHWGRAINKLERSSGVVFAGTPFIWRQRSRLCPSKCSNAEWRSATWDRLWREFPEKPVLNIAAGTSLEHGDDVDSVLADTGVVAFLMKALAHARLTTARDRLTQEIAAKLGFTIPVLPCTSLWAARAAGIDAVEPEYVAVNIMPAAVHKRRSQYTDPGRWQKVISEVVTEVERSRDITFISHSPDEDACAAALFPGRKRILSKDPQTLLRAYGKASMSICNRVHGAAAAASCGRPAILIGGDSRVELLHEFGFSTFDHRTVSTRTLLDAVAEAHSAPEATKSRLNALATKAESEYSRLLSTALSAAA